LESRFAFRPAEGRSIRDAARENDPTSRHVSSKFIGRPPGGGRRPLENDNRGPAGPILDEHQLLFFRPEVIQTSDGQGQRGATYAKDALHGTTLLFRRAAAREEPAAPDAISATSKRLSAFIVPLPHNPLRLIHSASGFNDDTGITASSQLFVCPKRAL
jgi:hypothetical protein